MLPFYELTINDDDETGVAYNALVDVPAHLKNFVAFGKGKVIKYSFNEESRMVTGVMIAAGQPIYRPADEDAPEHNVIFKAKTVEQIRRKFQLNQLGKAMNEMHDPDRKVEGVTMIDSYIIGGDKNPTAPEVFKHLNLQDGTWIASYYIQNDEVWRKVKAGEFAGFSVEGIFVRSEVQVKQNKFKNKMKKPIKNLWSFVFGAETEETFAEITTVDGVVLAYEGDLVAGTAVFVVTDGEQTPAPQDEYPVEMDGKQWILTIDENGLVATLEEVAMDADEEMISAKEFKKFMKDYNAKVDAKLKAADETIAMQEQKIKALEEFNKSKFNYSPRVPVKGAKGSYRDLL